MKLKDLLEKYGEYDVVLSKREATNEIMIEGRKPKPKTVWDLEKGDNHHWIDITGDVCINVPWKDTEEDKRSREMGIVFLTKEEAEQDVERRKVETLLLKHGGRRWFKEGKENWFITFDRSVCLCFFKYVYSIRDQRQGMIYFDTEEEITEAVEQIGAERIIKALFEVR